MEAKPDKKVKKGKRKNNLLTWIIVIVLLIGLGIMLYPTMCDLYNRWLALQEVKEYEHIVDAGKVDYSELWAKAEEYNRYLLNKPNQLTAAEDEVEHVATLLNPLGNGMMGYISIPKINVRLPIYQGMEEVALQAGAGYWIGSSLPTGGIGTHCVITAHTGLVKAKMFTDVDKLVEGDTFTLTILDRTLTYEVDQILVTEPDELDKLLVDPDMDFVTLYTCTPYGVNTHRLLVRGHRVESDTSKPSDVEPDANGNLAQNDSMRYIIGIGIAILALVILNIVVIICAKRSRVKSGNVKK